MIAQGAFEIPAWGQVEWKFQMISEHFLLGAIGGVDSTAWNSFIHCGVSEAQIFKTSVVMVSGCDLLVFSQVFGLSSCLGCLVFCFSLVRCDCEISSRIHVQ